MRCDLRLADNGALAAAVEEDARVVVVYVFAPEDEARWAPGAASRWWLHHSLEQLNESLRALGGALILRAGSALDEIPALAEQVGAEAVYWNCRYEPAARAVEKRLTEKLEQQNIEVQSFNSSLLIDPVDLKNGSGNPYLVFTAFWNAMRKRQVRGLYAPVKEIHSPSKLPRSLKLSDLQLLPKIKWDKGIQSAWTPGEASAHKRLRTFAQESLLKYPQGRDRPDWDHVSRMSPHLHFGEISSAQIWHGLVAEESFLREIAWREFAHYLLFHFPQTTEKPLRRQFEAFPWRCDKELLEAWQAGQTGYPIVDAGMRQLWTTGWMHNRVRMIVASFLVKDLLIPWQSGAQWFWDTLVDADLANNTLGWQWTAGCGADAAPYFRIFNPTTQGEKFDPDGQYVRQWVPELARLSSRWIHHPWDAPPLELQQSGITLGQTYPQPIVDHAAARRRALAAFATIRVKAI